MLNVQGVSKRLLSMVPLLLAGLTACTHMDNKADLPKALSWADDGFVIESSAELTHEILKNSKNKPVLIQFVTDGCKPCRESKRSVQKMAGDSDGQLIVIHLDVTHDEGAMQSFGMKAQFPAFKLVIPNGGRTLDTYGSDSLPELASLLSDRVE